MDKSSSNPLRAKDGSLPRWFKTELKVMLAIFLIAFVGMMAVVIFAFVKTMF